MYIFLCLLCLDMKNYFLNIVHDYLSHFFRTQPTILKVFNKCGIINSIFKKECLFRSSLVMFFLPCKFLLYYNFQY